MGGKSSQTYTTSPRMMEKENKNYGQLIYNHKLQKIIEEITEFVETDKMQEDGLESYLIDRIVDWFEPGKSKKGAIEFLDKLDRKKSKKKFIFTELKKKEALAQLLKKFEDEYRTLLVLEEVIQRFPKNIQARKNFYDTANSIKREQPISKLDLQNEAKTSIIYERIMRVFYLKILSKELANNHEETNIIISKFHERFGCMIIKFIQKKKLSVNQLLHIIYHLLLIASSGIKAEEERKNLIAENLESIENHFLKRFRDEEYTFDISSKEIQNIRYVSNCYLVELYHKSLLQIDNPFIDETKEEASIRKYLIFPVDTVRSRNLKKY